MPYVRVGQPVAIIRQPVIHHHHRAPPGVIPRGASIARNHHHHLPRHLPVLQPPHFPREYESYEEDIEQPQEYEEFYPEPIPDQYGLTTRHLSKKLFTYRLFPNILSSRSNHYMKHPHSSYVYYVR